MDRISALVDGELEQREAASLIPDLKQRDELRAAWSTYHLIGEAMRGQACVDCGVAEAIKRKLAAEPTVLAPKPGNAGVVKRWALPSMAAAAAVAAVTWMGVQAPGPGSDVQPASFVDARPHTIVNTLHTLADLGPAPATATGAPAIQLTNEAYQPYLMAHQPFSPSVAIQGLAPYMRSVSDGAAER